MTEPLTPSDCDLQDFPFMPLHVARLRDSDLAAEAHPEACWYAVLLWSAAWHQLPAGSLPNSEPILARLCGLGRDLKTFRRHRDDAMRGWVECADGRLYHPVVAEQVNASWAEKLAYRDRKAKRVAIAEKAAKARWGDSGDASDANAHAMHDASELDASCIADAMPKETGRGTGTGNYSEADASGAAAPQPIDLKAAIFASGLPLLMRADLSRDAAAKMLGKWKREHGDGAVLDALAHAQATGTPDPISLITATLGARNGQRNHQDHTRDRRGREEPIFAARRALGGDGSG